MANSTTTQQTQHRPTRMDAQQPREYVMPPANISATENEYVLELEMPGVPKENVEITTEGNELTIIGRRQSDPPDGELCYCESAFADYRRMFELGPDVDTSKITAEVSQGVLRLRLPKSEKARPRKIQIAG
jgi:HSP20 family protein